MKKVVFFFAILVLASCGRMGNKTIKDNPPIPDSAVNFGWENEWIVVKTANQNEVAKVLGLKNTSKCNWENGRKSSEDSGIFITPAIDGWTIVCGWGLSYSGITNFGDSEQSFIPLKKVLKFLSEKFGEAEYFCTEHVTETHCWIKATNDSIIRAYCYSGEIGKNVLVEGIPSDSEKKYNLINTFSEEAKRDSNYLERKDILVPDEDFVMQMARNWSIDPTSLSERKDLFGKFGLIGER